MALTKEQIFNAADALVANGLDPTLEAIRAKLGVTTPPLSDLIAETDAMNAWKAHHAAKTQRSGESTPPAVTARVTEFGTQIWTTALELANQRLAPERKALGEARAAFEAKQQQAQSDTQALHAQLIAANERATAAMARIEPLEKRVADLSTKLAHVGEENHQLVAAIKATVGIVNEA
jgi:colicin import membrane protein